MSNLSIALSPLLSSSLHTYTVHASIDLNLFYVTNLLDLTVTHGSLLLIKHIKYPMAVLPYVFIFLLCTQLSIQKKSGLKLNHCFDLSFHRHYSNLYFAG